MPKFLSHTTGLDKTDVGLTNVDNTSDANKPVSTAEQTALNLKANLVSPAFTGTPTGITKAHVGLTNVDDTSDANKPVSTAQATADTTAKARANHTGTQVASTISDFNTAADARATVVHNAKICQGSVSITPGTANVPASAAISFGITYASAPIVVTAPATSSVGTSGVTGTGVSAITTTGCTIWLNRANTTATFVNWIASGT